MPEPIAPIATPNPNFLSADVEIKGTLVFEHALISHGRIEGEILTPGSLTVGKTGKVQGDVQAGTVAIHGAVNGNVKAQSRCELKGDAQLIGDLDAPRLIMEEGATFVGRANVVPSSDLPLAARAARRT
jgi:cytoskeletal protein CcmA (bactofilin family)